MSILNLVRPELLNSPSYVPGGEEIQYRLHANELPWAPIDLESLELNFYPKYQAQRELLDQLADYYQVEKNQITLTRGNNDGIDLVSRLFLKAGKNALLHVPPTFALYAFFARLQQAELLQCPLSFTTNFNLTLEDICNSWQPNCTVIMLCNPNNPTGSLINLEFIETVCTYYTNKSIVVIDETYMEFAKGQSASTLVSQFENLVVLKTLSKSAGLAGLRLGSIIAQAHVIQAFNKIIAPYTMSSAVIKLAIKALRDKAWFATAIDTIRTQRDWLINELQKISVQSVIEKTYPSEANFLLIKTPYAKQLAQYFASHGIAIRDFSSDTLLHNHIRITVGNETQNQLLISTLSSFIDTQLQDL
jgi:histidinol-phosphate aminotransferase